MNAYHDQHILDQIEKKLSQVIKDPNLLDSEVKLLSISVDSWRMFPMLADVLNSLLENVSKEKEHQIGIVIKLMEQKKTYSNAFQQPFGNISPASKNVEVAFFACPTSPAQTTADDHLIIPYGIDLCGEDDLVFLRKIYHIIINRLDDSDFSVSNLVYELGMSRTKVHQKMKKILGRSTSSYIRFIRVREALERLKKGQFSISEIAYSVGFKDPSYFTRSFVDEFGLRPSEVEVLALA